MLSLPALVAPTKVLIVPLSARKFDHLVREVCESNPIRPGALIVAAEH